MDGPDIEERTDPSETAIKMSAIELSQQDFVKMNGAPDSNDAHEQSLIV